MERHVIAAMREIADQHQIVSRRRRLGIEATACGTAREMRASEILGAETKKCSGSKLENPLSRLTLAGSDGNTIYYTWPLEFAFLPTATTATIQGRFQCIQPSSSDPSPSQVTRRA
jgi:hypothetical protein